jgi:steroid delta-isomerase-like uncharacterized protein
MTTFLDNNRRLVRRFMEDIWSRGDPQAINECLTDDFTFELSFTTVRGIPDFTAMVERNRLAFRNLTYRVDDTVAEETKAAVFWTMTSTHVGTWREVEGTNRDVSIRGMTVFYIREGRIYEAYVENDVLGLMTQIGGVVMTPPLQRNKALMNRYVEIVLNGRDVNRFNEVVASDFVAHRADQVLQGIDTLERQMESWWRAFPDLHFTADIMMAEENRVAISYTAPGTHKGEFAGIAPTGRQITWRGIMIYTIRDNRVAEAIAQWNDRDVIEQLTRSV